MHSARIERATRTDAGLGRERVVRQVRWIPGPPDEPPRKAMLFEKSGDWGNWEQRDEAFGRQYEVVIQYSMMLDTLWDFLPDVLGVESATVDLETLEEDPDPLTWIDELRWTYAGGTTVYRKLRTDDYSRHWFEMRAEGPVQVPFAQPDIDRMLGEVVGRLVEGSFYYQSDSMY